jgi:hypothetical protein
MNSKTTLYLYFVTVGLFSLAMLGGGVMDLRQPPEVMEGMRHLGYPDYFASILGAWKILGVIALLWPGMSRLKEWTYAGFTFDLTGAAISHLASGDGLGKAGVPLALLAVGLASWALRPEGRRLPSEAARVAA